MMLHDLSIDPRFTHAGAKKILGRGPDMICSDLSSYYHHRVLFILRDPRDTVVSHSHHYVRQKTWDSDLAGFIREPETGFERLLTFNLGWLEAASDFKGFTVVRYEDLRQNAESELARITTFLRCGKLSPAEFARVVVNHAFETMRNREQSGELHQHFGDRFTLGSDHDSERIVRRGVIGGHVDEMTPADQVFCEQLLTRYDYQSRIDNLIAHNAGHTFVSR